MSTLTKIRNAYTRTKKAMPVTIAACFTVPQIAMASRNACCFAGFLGASLRDRLVILCKAFSGCSLVLSLFIRLFFQKSKGAGEARCRNSPAPIL